MHQKPHRPTQPTHEQSRVHALRAQKLLSSSTHQIAQHTQRALVPPRSQQHGHARIVRLRSRKDEKRCSALPSSQKKHLPLAKTHPAVILCGEAACLLKIPIFKQRQLLRHLSTHFQPTRQRSQHQNT